MNDNACSNISVTIPASFDSISTKISKFAISTKAKHGEMFVVAFSVFGSVICGTAVSFP